MGTNYYLKTNICDHCNRGEDDLHIGKNSSGWSFSLHIDTFLINKDEKVNEWEMLEIKGLEDWKKLFKNPKHKIFNEYGKPIDSNELLNIIQKKEFKRRQSEVNIYATIEDNWDLCPGEFS